MAERKSGLFASKNDRFRPVADDRKITHVAQMEARSSIEQDRAGNVGDAWTMLVVNVIFIGFLATSMVQGPYSSHEQEVWYRYGSICFFIAGVIFPAVVLFVMRQSRLIVVSANVWMFAILLGFVLFGAMSSGGV